MQSFSVIFRNPGHWDICSDRKRDFRIRGEPGDVIVSDERDSRNRTNQGWQKFKTVTAALAYIADEYMASPMVAVPGASAITPEGEPFTIGRGEKEVLPSPHPLHQARDGDPF